MIAFTEFQFDVSREVVVWKARICTFATPLIDYNNAGESLSFFSSESPSLRYTMDRTLDEIVSERNVGPELCPERAQPRGGGTLEEDANS